MTYLKVVHGVVLLLFGLGVWAADPADPDEANQEGEMVTLAETLTVSAELKPVLVKQTTAKVTVIDDQQIEKRVVNDLRDLVKYEPGVFIEQEGSRLGLNGFNIRGIGGNRVLTRIDGVATAHQFSFGPLAVHQIGVDVDTLKSVEILRGASSSLYGSDALGGVVSLTTKDPGDYLKSWDEARGFQFKSGYDSKSDATDLGLISAISLGSFELLAHGVRRDYQARENRGGVTSLDASRTAPNDLDGRSLQLQTKLVYAFNPQNRLRLSVELFDNQVDSLLYTGQGTTSEFGVTTTISDYTADDQQQRTRLSLDQDVSGIDKPMVDNLLWRLHLQNNETEQFTSERRSSMLPQGSQNILRRGLMSFAQDGFGAEVVLSKAFTTGANGYRLTYGLAFEQTDFGQLRDRTEFDLDTSDPDAYNGTLIFPTRYFPNSTVQEYGGFVQLEASFLGDRLRVTPGLRFDRYELNPQANDVVYLQSTGVDTPPVGLKDGATSPKLGLLWQINKHFAWAAHYAHGFRTPAYSSVNSGFTNLAGGYQSLPNPNLTPEESDNLETSFRVYGKQASLNITWFDNSFDDFIADTQFVGVSETGLALFQAQNLNDVAIQGIELAGDWWLSDQFSSRLSYARISGEDRESGNPIESIQPEKAVLGLAWQESQARFGSELTITHVAAKDGSDVVAEDAFLPDAYTLMDWTVFYQVNQRLKVFAGGFNLGDKTYFPFSDVRGRSADDPVIDRYSAPGRNFSANMRYRW